MTTHVSPEQMKAFCDRTLEDSEFTRIGEHFIACNECMELFRATFRAKRASSPVTTEGLSRSLFSYEWLKDEHVEYEQLAAHLDNSPELDEDDREMFEIHLKMCPQCREDFRQLKQFRQDMIPYLNVRYYPETKSGAQRVKEYLVRKTRLVRKAKPNQPGH